MKINLNELMEKELNGENKVEVAKDIKVYIDELLELNKVLNQESKNSKYLIKIEPLIGSGKEISVINLTLEDVNQNIKLFTTSTMQNYHTVRGQKGYFTDSELESVGDHVVSEDKISFNWSTSHFKEVVEQLIVDAFITNEKF